VHREHVRVHGSDRAAGHVRLRACICTTCAVVLHHLRCGTAPLALGCVLLPEVFFLAGAR
jgi:hypothetical protein